MLGIETDPLHLSCPVGDFYFVHDVAEIYLPALPPVTVRVTIITTVLPNAAFDTALKK